MEQTLALVQDVKSQPAPLQTVEAPLIAIEEALKANPLPDAGMAAMTWQVSQRDEIVQRVASFKAHQQKLQKEREEFFIRKMTHARHSFENPATKPAESN